MKLKDDGKAYLDNAEYEHLKSNNLIMFDAKQREGLLYKGYFYPIVIEAQEPACEIGN